MFPKIIWRYWEQGWNNSPFVVRHCTESVKKYAADWEVIDLDGQSVSQYLQLPKQILEVDNLPVQVRSDIIRLMLLEKYGGVWLDATVFLNTKLSDFLAPLYGDFFCFWRFKEKIRMSNWFIASIKNSYAITKWLNQFKLTVLSKKWIDQNQRYFLNWKASPNYFVCHKTFEKMIKTDDALYNIVRDMPFRSSIICFLVGLYGVNNDISYDIKRRIDHDMPVAKLMHTTMEENFNQHGALAYLFNRLHSNSLAHDFYISTLSLKSISIFSEILNKPSYMNDLCGSFSSRSSIAIEGIKYPHFHVYNFSSSDKKNCSQLIIPYGDNRLFIRRQDGNVFTELKEIACKDEIDKLRKEINELKEALSLKKYNNVENQSDIKINNASLTGPKIIVSERKDAFSTLQKHNKHCCGCGCCVLICPHHALSMIENTRGFLEPHINLGKCVECALCVKKCPILSKKNNRNNPSPEIFVFSGAEDLLKQSSSGGAFSILANYILSCGGVVFGAAYRNNFSVHHMHIEKSEDLDILRLSKYVQSDQEDCYRDVRDMLKQGRIVLYSGTPCQIAGLLNYLGEGEWSGLYTIDLLCHGVPSYMLLRRYLDETCGLDNVEHIEMRRREGWSSCIDIYLKSGEVIRDVNHTSPFMLAFLKDIALRESCYSCAFASLPRQGDVTLGDCWSAKKLGIGLPYEKKSSIVLVNNTKGKMLWSKALTGNPENHCLPLKDIPLKQLNKNIYAPNAKHTSDADEFWKRVIQQPFSEAVLKSVTPANVGLILYASDNYGSCATNVALYKVIENLGYSPIILNSLVAPRGVSADYMKKYMRFSSTIMKDGDYKAANVLCDSFVIGSDYSMNIKAPITVNHIEYMLMAFAGSKKRKIAYASSLGMPPVNKDIATCKLYATLLSRFQLVGFREDSAVELASKYFGIHPEWVLDPVFLLESKNFQEIASQSAFKDNEQYLLVYILEPTPEKLQLVHLATEQLKMKRYILVDRERFNIRRPLFGDDPTVVGKISFEDWLAYFVHCSHIITDSFHGACFAVMLEKPYIAIKRGNKKRFDALATLLGGEDDHSSVQIFNSVTEVTDRSNLFSILDFKNLNERIKQKKDVCLELLKHALQADVSKQRDEDIDSLVAFARKWKESRIFYPTFWKKILGKNALPAGITIMDKFNKHYLQFYLQGVSKKIHYELLCGDKNGIKVCFHIEDGTIWNDVTKAWCADLARNTGFSLTKKGVERNSTADKCMEVLINFMILSMEDVLHFCKFPYNIQCTKKRVQLDLKGSNGERKTSSSVMGKFFKGMLRHFINKK